MPTQLILDDEYSIPFEVDNHVREVWAIQYSRSLQVGRLDQLAARLGAAFSSALAGCLDYDLQPPSDAKVQFATAISRQLGVALPAEALRFRGAMDEFLDRFADAYKKHRQSR